MTLIVHVPRQGSLPATISAESLEGRPFNAGLLFQRYAGLPLVRSRGKDADAGSDPFKAATTFVRAFNKLKADLERTLQETHARLDRLGGHARRADAPAAGWHHAWMDIALESPLAVGLGNVHPFENGLTFHHTLGVPFLPGTSVKGLGRAWASLLGAAGVAEGWGQGPDPDGRNARMGRLVFLDALPLSWPELEVDIVNCHLQGYYRGDGNLGAVPNEEPIPAYMVVVKPGVKFRFRVGGAEPGEAMDLLRDALAMLGIGAKTAAGYGYFGHDVRSSDDWGGTQPQDDAGAKVSNGPLKVFLSHSSTDKGDVGALADALNCRGLVPWLDTDNLVLGHSLGDALREAINGAASFAALLSPPALRSDWVREELAEAMRAEEREKSFRILPVLMGVSDADLRAHGSFGTWFRGDRLDRLAARGGAAFDASLADQLARAVFQHCGVREASSWTLVCDQRGEGLRVGAPALPAGATGPWLVFRPDRGARTEQEVKSGAAWLEWRSAMQIGLSEALGNAGNAGVRREVFLHLRAQLAVGFWLGHRLDRQTAHALAVWDQRGARWRAIGEPVIEGLPIELEALAAGSGDSIDLALGHDAGLTPWPLFLPRVIQHRKAAGVTSPLYGWKGPFFADDDPLAPWAQGVASAIQALGRRHVRIYTTCPLIALVALGRALTRHSARSVTFMEWDAAAASGSPDEYRACEIF